MEQMFSSTSTQVNLPRITITYCTKCKWLLRAAYYGQELLSTFETSIGELVLTPTVGGIFTVHVEPASTELANGDKAGTRGVEKMLIWDRKTENGFPETKILKQRIRNIIQPDRDLGHTDTPVKSGSGGLQAGTDGDRGETEALKVKDNEKVTAVVEPEQQQSGSVACEDCK